MMQRLAKATILKVVCGYDLYTIYRSPKEIHEPAEQQNIRFKPVNDRQVILSSPSATIRGLAGFGGDEAAGFGAWSDGHLVSLCWFWWGERYRAARTVWPIDGPAAKLVQISTEETFRGRGIAAGLIQYAAYKLQQQGMGPLYARIWHSNTPSIRAFRKAGWTPAAFVGRVALSPSRYNRLIIQWRPKLRCTLSSRLEKGE
jgi:GNAT superfamily N-acetyltransferase